MIMEFFFEMVLTVVVALFFSFLVAKLVTAGNGGNDLSSDQVEIGVGDEKIVVSKEVRSGLKVDACVIESEKGLLVVEENVDRFGNEADRVDEVHEADRVDEVQEADRVDEVQEVAIGNAKIVPLREELVGLTVEAESTAVNSSEINVIDEMIICGLDEQSGELLAEFTDSASPEAEEIMLQGADERSEDVVVAESEEVKVEEREEEKEEVSIEEEDDDWEGIERSELEKAFAATAKLLEESGRADEIGAQAKLELYGLHMIATSGPCRETQPMAVMISARAKWNAWQKLGNMSQEEAMEQYLALVSKEVPGLMNADQTVKMSEMETSVSLPTNSSYK